MILDTFAYVFEGKLDPLKQGVEEADKKAKQLTKTMDGVDRKAAGSGQQLVGFLKSVAGLAGIGFSVGATISNAINQATNMDNLNRMAESIGVGTENLDALGRASQRAGGSAEGMQTSLSALNTAIKSALVDSTGEARRNFNIFGVSLRDAGGMVRQTDDILLSLADTMQGMDRIKAETIAKRFGITDQSTIELLMKGRKAVQELTAAEKERSHVNAQSIESARKLRSSITDLKMVFGDLSSQSLGGLVPILEKGAKWLTKLGDFARDNKELVVLFFTAVGTVITAVYLPAMASAAAATIVATLPILAAIAAFVLFGLVIDDLNNFLEGNDSILKRIVDSIDEWLGQWPVLQGYFRNYIDLVKLAGGLFLKLFQPDTYINMIKEIGASITKWIMQPLNQVKKIANDLIDFLGVGIEKFKIEGEIEDPPLDYSNVNTSADVPSLTPRKEPPLDYSNVNTSADVPSLTPRKEPPFDYSSVNTSADVPNLTPRKEAIIGLSKINAANNNPLNNMNTTTLNNQRSSISRESNVTIQSVTVNTQATDPEAVSKAISDSLADQLSKANDQFDDALLA